MESIKILIPINKSPHSNDLMTDQAKNICKSFYSKCDIHIIWAIFPSNVAHHLWDNEEEVRVGKKIEIVKAKDFRNAVDLIKQVNPNIIMVNGSIDFHNVECNLAGKFLKIPTVVLFFRNRKTAISISKKSVILKITSASVSNFKISSLCRENKVDNFSISLLNGYCCIAVIFHFILISIFIFLKHYVQQI